MTAGCAVDVHRSRVWSRLKPNKRHWSKAAQLLARTDHTWLGHLITRRHPVGVQARSHVAGSEGRLCPPITLAVTTCCDRWSACRDALCRLQPHLARLVLDSLEQRSESRDESQPLAEGREIVAKTLARLSLHGLGSTTIVPASRRNPPVRRGPTSRRRPQCRRSKLPADVGSCRFQGRHLTDETWECETPSSGVFACVATLNIGVIVPVTRPHGWELMLSLSSVRLI